VRGTAARHRQDADDHYEQPGNLYRLLSDDERKRLCDNIAGSLGKAPEDVQKLQVRHFLRADEDYGRSVAERLGLSLESVRAEAAQ